MMSYKEPVGQELNLRDPFQRIRKFRPLIPRPNYLYSYPNHNHINNSSCLNRLHHQYHDFGSNKGVEESRKEGHIEQEVMVSSRWNPTPEQLTALEELYRCGTRTPSAEQIQHITAQLRHYGKIEGKNVFYWFQNHKARERQKRRRQLQLPLSVTTSHANINNNRLREDVHDIVDTIQRNDKGPEALRIGIEDEEKNCKRTPFMITKECRDHPMELAAGPRKADITSTDAWFQFNETSAASALEFHHSNNLCSSKDLFVSGQKNATWPANTSIVQQTSSCFSSPPHYLHDDAPPSLQLFSLSSKLTCSPDQVVHESPESGVDEREDGNGEPTMALTLQLFPLLTSDKDVANADMMKNDSEIISSALDSTDGKIMSCMDSDEFVPYYQFL